MPEWQDLFAPSEEGGPGGDFEERVFAKIRRRRQHRRVGMGLAAAATAALLALVVFGPLRPAPDPGPLRAEHKVEIPVSEELVFSTSDRTTGYSLQPVALGEAGGAASESRNQI